MFYDTSVAHSRQNDRPLACHMHARLAQHLDIRLVQTALDLIQVILTHRHRAMGAAAFRTGRLSAWPRPGTGWHQAHRNLVHADHWSADTIKATSCWTTGARSAKPGRVRVASAR
jgi:hypothetical protein